MNWDWVASAVKYAPEILDAGKAINSWATGEQSGETTADLVKPVVMLGARMLAENNCQTAVEAGATTAASSAAYDIAVSQMTGKDYGLVKDINSGDYATAAAKSMQEFGTGALAHSYRSKPQGHRKQREKRALQMGASLEDDDDETATSPFSIENFVRSIAEAFPQDHTLSRANQWRFDERFDPDQP